MKTPERFDRAMTALIKAFFNDHLAKYTCTACAVGNIVAAGYGVTASVDPTNIDAINKYWIKLISSEAGKCITNFEDFRKNIVLASNNTPWIDHSWGRPLDGLYNKAIDNIRVTGYSVEELYKIEEAFERNTQIKYSQYSGTSKNRIMEDQFNGLMAVVDVLCQLDGIEPTEYKKSFEYNSELKPVNV